MKENVIAYVTPKVGWQKYAATQTVDKNRIKTLALKRVEDNGELSDYSIRKKHYLENGSIIRTNEYGSSVIPKNGSGSFEIIDRGFTVKGKLKNGKIMQLDRLVESSANTGFQELDYFLKGSSELSRDAIESLLRKTEQGTLKFQNVTKVMLKKILAYLPK